MAASSAAMTGRCRVASIPVLGGEALVRFLSRSSLRIPATRMARMPISAPEKNTAIAAVEMMDVIASPFGLEGCRQAGYRAWTA